MKLKIEKEIISAFKRNFKPLKKNKLEFFLKFNLLKWIFKRIIC